MGNIPEHSNLVQGMKSNIPSIEMSRVSYQKYINESKYFFYIDFLDPEIIDGHCVIRPGKKYTIRVVSSNSGSDKDGGLIIGSKVRMQLLYKNVNEIEVKEWVVEPGCVSQNNEFEFTIPEQIPNINTVISLEYCDESLSSKCFRSITDREVYIDGTYNPESFEHLEQLNIPVDTKPPEFFVIMEVNSLLDGNKSSLTLCNIKKRQFEKQLVFPKIGLATYVEHDRSPSNLLGEIRSFSSQDIFGIKKWLTPLFNAYQNNLILSIYDYTNSEFPWELLEFDDGKFLGATIQIVRNFTISGSQSEEFISEPKSIAAYIDTENIKTNTEAEAIGLFSNNIFTDFGSFRELLDNDIHDFEMIYLATHGSFAMEDYSKIFLGSLQNPYNRIRPLQDLYLINTCKGHRPIFFVNACHSARFQMENTGRIIGLPYVILERLARGYIGTMGPVGSNSASIVAAKIFKLINDNQGNISIPEILRQVRSDAANKFLKNKTDKQCQLEWLYTFMYVYYGDPTDVILLMQLPRGEKHD